MLEPVQDLKRLVMDACSAHLSGFEQAVTGTTYEKGGIWNSEMLVVCAVSAALGAEVVLESGRYRGQSTVVMSSFFPHDVHIFSIERNRDDAAALAEERLRDSGVRLLYGDSRAVVPLVARQVAGRRITLLVDGPKGQAAVELVQDAVGREADLVVAFVHDSASQEAKSLIRDAFNDVFFTDDADFVATFSYLDDPAYVAAYRKRSAASTSYGPTLAVILPDATEASVVRFPSSAGEVISTLLVAFAPWRASSRRPAARKALRTYLATRPALASLAAVARRRDANHLGGVSPWELFLSWRRSSRALRKVVPVRHPGRRVSS